MQTAQPLLTEYNEPILFRTVCRDVYEPTLRSGSVWLRSDAYYRKIEDAVRQDVSEGANMSLISYPLYIARHNAPQVTIQGSGEIGVAIRPHYIISLHGLSIAKRLVTEFGGHTFGIKSLSRLSAEILYTASQQIRCSGYRFGAVAYQRTSLGLVLGSNGGGAVQLPGNPPCILTATNTDVLRKDPVQPFIDQDEWRIVVFTNGYLNNDAQEPLKVNVSPDHFFPYSNFAIPQQADVIDSG